MQWIFNNLGHTYYECLCWHICSSIQSGEDCNKLKSTCTLFFVLLTLLLHVHVLQVSKCWYTCQGISSALTCKSQTLKPKYIYRFKWVDHFWQVKASSCIVEGSQNDSKKLPCVHIWVNSQNSQLTDSDHYSYLPLKFSYIRRVNAVSWLILTSIVTCH